MVSQLSICFLKLLWHGRHGLRVVLVHSWTDHVSAHNAVYFWLCTGFGENRNNLARGVLFWKMLDLCTCECYIHFRVSCQRTLIKGSAAASHFQTLSSVSNKCKPSMCSLLCHMDKVTQQANILIRIRSLFCTLHMESIFRALTTIPKYFDRTFQYNVGERQKDRSGGRISKYQKPHNHSKGQITQEHFVTFLRPRLRRRGEMVLPGAIWQETLKVDGADMSPSLLSTMTHFRPQTFILTCSSLPLSSSAAIFDHFYSKTPCNSEGKKDFRGFITQRLQAAILSLFCLTTLSYKYQIWQYNIIFYRVLCPTNTVSKIDHFFILTQDKCVLFFKLVLWMNHWLTSPYSGRDVWLYIVLQ